MVRSWHKAANVMYVDQPVGTGLSFTTKGNYADNDLEVCSTFTPPSAADSAAAAVVCAKSPQSAARLLSLGGASSRESKVSPWRPHIPDMALAVCVFAFFYFFLRIPTRFPVLGVSCNLSCLASFTPVYLFRSAGLFVDTYILL